MTLKPPVDGSKSFIQTIHSKQRIHLETEQVIYERIIESLTQMIRS